MPVILSGLKEVSAALHKEVAVMEKKSMSGLIKASIIVRRAMEKTPPKTPAKYSNLRASWFTTTPKSIPAGRSPTFNGDDAGKMSADHNNAISKAQGEISSATSPVLIMGFSASYAPWVHEMVDSVNWTREGSGSHWFEIALKNNREEMLKVIAESCQIKEDKK